MDKGLRLLKMVIKSRWSGNDVVQSSVDRRVSSISSQPTAGWRGRCRLRLCVLLSTNIELCQNSMRRPTQTHNSPHRRWTTASLLWWSTDKYSPSAHKEEEMLWRAVTYSKAFASNHMLRQKLQGFQWVVQRCHTTIPPFRRDILASGCRWLIRRAPWIKMMLWSGIHASTREFCGLLNNSDWRASQVKSSVTCLGH